MKKKLMLVAFMSLSMAAMAAIQPPITGGAGANASMSEVRITANVVEGVAVNETSPIDFGNLARGMHVGTVNHNIPGEIHLKGTAGDNINVKLDTDMADLVWLGANGTDDKAPGANRDFIKDVQVYGLTTTDTTIALGGTGEARRSLTASFVAGQGADQNLGSSQKLGSYSGRVMVTAVKQ